jgi:hypothetical protein
MQVSRYLKVVLFVFCVVGFMVREGAAIPYCRTCPFDCDDLGLEDGGKDCSDRGDSGNACCVDLSPKGLDLAEAQDDVNDDQEEDDDEECPAGFEESEDKCTEEEREEGCKDIRLDNGKGCVNRN